MQTEKVYGTGVAVSSDDDDSDFGEFASAPGSMPFVSESLTSPQGDFHPQLPSSAPEKPNADNAVASSIPFRRNSPAHVDILPVPLGQSLPAELSPALPVGGDEIVISNTITLPEMIRAPFNSSDENTGAPPLTPYQYAAAAKNGLEDKSVSANGNALVGFDTLDPVQSYAVGALTVVLLRKYSRDLNGLAFARAHVDNILKSLCLTEGQQAALFALSPAKEDFRDVVEQCVELVGEESTRFRAVQAMLALAVARGVYDARSRAFLCCIANAFGVPWSQVAAVELAIAIQLFSQADIDLTNGFETPVDSGRVSTDSTVSEVSAPKTAGTIMAERRRKKQKAKRVMKVGGITLVGGILFGVTGGIIAPALLSALAGVGVTSAAGLAASGTVASGAVVGSLFGVAGAGVTQGKARKRTISRLEEFDFERPDDPRVIEEKERRAEREAQKVAKQQQLLLKQDGEEPIHLLDLPEDELRIPERALGSPRVRAKLSQEDEDDLDADDESVFEDQKGKKKKGKKHEKLVVGSQGLEAAGQIPSLHICICVPAWLNERRYGSSLRQFEDALKAELPCSQHIALRWESRRLFEMGLAFAKFWASKATVTTIQNAYPHAVAAASSVAGAIAFAFALPLTVLSCLDYIDNPWSVLVSLSNIAGEDLADVLVARSYGQRPVTLFGYSVGARVIFKCLESLASRNAFGIVDNVFLMSAPVSADPKRWAKIRPVVAGRIVNGYGTMDWALAFFHRGCGHGVYVSGLRAVDHDGIENLNLSYIGLEGHKELKDVIPRAMQVMGVGRGYISIPPAKVVSRSSRHNGAKAEEFRDALDDRSKLENESQLPHPTSETNSAIINDKLWNSANLKIAAIPTRKAVEKEEGREAKEKEKKKGKSWYKLPHWNSKKSNPEKNDDSNGLNSHIVDEPTIDAPGKVASPDASSILRGGGTATLNSGNKTPVTHEEQLVDIFDGVKSDDEEDEEVLFENPASNGFDWDLQRRIWEQQEQQLQERGFADEMVDVETGTKTVLGIGIEIAGLRIHSFIPQDSELPVEPVVEYFTNCCFDQKGLTIRLYEHEKKRKSLPLNPFRQEKKYPKLLDDLELPWTERKPRGEARFAVSVEATAEGDIIAKIREKHRNGKSGEERELRVSRSKLCTMRERSELEAKDKQLLILPAPSLHAT